MKNISVFLCLFLLTFSGNAQNAGDWRELGPTYFPINVSGQINGIGRICQLKFHPKKANIIFAASASGGLWKSSNNANSWQMLNTDFLPKMNCASVCIDHSNDSVIYLGTGDPNYYNSSIGIYKSSDAGQSWKAINSGLGNRMALELLMDPNNAQVLLAATNSGIYKTSNAGTSWSLVKSGGQFQDMAFAPNQNSKIVYAVTGTELFRSENMGDSWTKITSGLTIPASTSGSGLRIAVSRSQPEAVFIASIQGEGTIFKSTDYGVNFTKIYGNPNKSLVGYDEAGAGQGNYNFSFCADPTNANNLFVVSHCVWRSTNGGTSWTRLTNWYEKVHTDMHQIVFTPHESAKLYNANDGGIWLSTNLGATWTVKSNLLGTTEITHAAQSNVKRNLVSIGTQDNGELYYLDGNWKTNRGGDWYSTAYFDNQANDYVYYAQNGSRRRLPNGNENSLNLNAVNHSNSVQYSFPIADNTAGFIADNNLYRSTNLQNAFPIWTKLADYNTAIVRLHSALNGTKNLFAIADDKKIYRYTDYSDASLTPTILTAPINTNLYADITTVSNDTKVLYLSAGTRVYRSDDEGQTWTNISAGLPTVNIIKLIHDVYSTDEAIYACSAKGVYYHDKNSNTWLNYSKGLPTVADITDFMIYNNNTNQSVLRVSYYGRGVWESMLNKSSKPLAQVLGDIVACVDSDVSFNDNSQGAPTSWLWSFPGGTPATSTQQNPSVRFTSAGQKDITLIASNALGSDTVQMTKFITVFTPPQKGIINNADGFLFCSQVADSYQWFLNDTALAGATGNEIEALQKGIYTVLLSNGNGTCSTTSDAYVFDPNTVSELSELQSISLYPNPSTGCLQIESKELKTPLKNIRMLSLNGQVITPQLLEEQVGNVKLNTGELAPGVYLLELMINKKPIYKRFVKN